MRDTKNVIKLINNLSEKRSARRKEGLFVIEGLHLIEEAGKKVKFAVYSENLPIVQKLEEQGTGCYKVSRKQLEEISGVETPQGIIGVARQFDYSMRDLFKGDKTLIVYCLGVQDPGNLGTIIRSADAFGASGVIISKGTVDLYNPKVVRSTMGSIFHLPIITRENDVETIEHLKKENVKVVASVLGTDMRLDEVALAGPVAFLVGNEGAGLSEEVVGLADAKVNIPMLGKAESLNVGIAASIMLYERGGFFVIL
ncbi:MAG: RNA methyltransferase [Candidatus Margulisbacteria bacterium]|nr:RNA methyltransferase [Candidatus Margulisiibacteriota bacterium]